MPYHNWSEEDFDWKGLSEAIHYITTYLRRYGKIMAHGKEKYGTARIYCHFGYLSLHGLVYPAYVSNQFPKWLWNFDCEYIAPVLRKLFEKSFVKWQMFIYNRAYQNALKKWPTLREEILCDADYLELIKGATREEETETEIITHVLGWNGESVSQWISSKPEKDN